MPYKTPLNDRICECCRYRRNELIMRPKRKSFIARLIDALNR